MAVCYILMSFVTRSLEMEEDLEAIMEMLDKWDIDLRVRWIPSEEMPADYFSREADNGSHPARSPHPVPTLRTEVRQLCSS